ERGRLGSVGTQSRTFPVAGYPTDSLNLPRKTAFRSPSPSGSTAVELALRFDVSFIIIILLIILIIKRLRLRLRLRDMSEAALTQQQWGRGEGNVCANSKSSWILRIPA